MMSYIWGSEDAGELLETCFQRLFGVIRYVDFTFNIFWKIIQEIY